MVEQIENFLKKLCISEKEKELKKILDQIPDQETKDRYFYNWLSEQWNLLGGMKEKQTSFNFDDERNLKTSDRFYNNSVKGVIYSGILMADETLDVVIEKDFMLFNSFDFWVRTYAVGSAIYLDGYIYQDQRVRIYEKSLGIGYFNEHVDLTNNNKFFLSIWNFGIAGIYYKVIFHKQKKTKISDIAYAPSWDTIKDIGASKNALYDKISTLILTDLISRNHADLQNILSNQHHEKTASGEISLADLLEKEHISLTDILPNQHHEKTASGEISLADLLEKKHISLTDILPNQHHEKYKDSEAVSAMGTKADSNPLHHDKTPPGDATREWLINELLIDEIIVTKRALVSDFQENAGTGTMNNPQRLNDNDVGSASMAMVVNQYTEINFWKPVLIKRWRQYGNTNNYGDGIWKIQYFDLLSSTWVNWVTGIPVRDDNSWSSYATETLKLTNKIKLVCTTKDLANSIINELEVIY